jgi:UPF0176 protein
MNTAENPNLWNIIDERHYTVAAFYQFASLNNILSLQTELKKLCQRNEIFGTILLASEGINGTIAGKQSSINCLFKWLEEQPSFNKIQVKYSKSDSPAFHRLKVRIKKEIVTMGKTEINPNAVVGTYIKPENWNDLINDPETLIIDTRNEYEIEIGTFKNSTNPQTKSFREFPDWVKAELDTLPDNKRPKQIAMFCTGGIRCEKATSYLAQKGYENVFHLEGGILKYLETIPEEDSTWLGDCFVFDQRVSVEHGLVPGKYKMCHACRLPLAPEDLNSKNYQPGVSCPKCFGSHTPKQKKRFKERQHQVELAKERGVIHIGTTFRKHS